MRAHKLKRLWELWDADDDHSRVLKSSSPADVAAFAAILCESYTADVAVVEICTLARLLKQAQRTKEQRV